MACKSKTCQSGSKETAKPGNSSRKTVQSTEFTLVAPDAQEVYLTGNFNEWNPTEHAMRKFKGGKFIKKLKLNPGRYEYQFIVDGQWWADPANPRRETTAFGSENSVIEIADNVVAYK